MRLGVRAHDFGKMPLDILAAKIAQKGLSCIQLTLQSAIEGIDTSPEKLNPGMANYIGEVFHKQNIQIAVLSSYVNPSHPEDAERKKNVDRFKAHVRFARDFGCSIVATETGKSEDHSEESFQTCLKSIGEMVEEAEKFGVFVCIEGVAKHVMNTPKTIKRMLDSIQSNNLQILFDPVNLISVDNYQDRERMIEEAFDLFGDKILVFHAKDFSVANGQVKNAQIGEGILDYRPIIRLLQERKPYINFIMEGVEMPAIDNSLHYLKGLME